jgi:hypothetical protein
MNTTTTTPPTAKQLAKEIHLDKLRDRDPKAAAEMEVRDVQAVRLTRASIVPGVPGIAATGSVFLLIGSTLPPGFITAATAAKLLTNSAAVPVKLEDLAAEIPQ